MKYVSFPWPPVEAALSVFNVSLFVKDFIFEKDVVKIREVAVVTES